MIEPIDPDRAFALRHVASARRAAVGALWALDEQLGRIVATTTQPMVGMMRLMWWRDAIATGVAGHPLLDALTSAFARTLGGEVLSTIVDGWEELLEPLPLTCDQLELFARNRGSRLFELTARLCDVTCPGEAGAGWALCDFGLRCTDSVTSSRALDMARDALSAVDPGTVPRPLRILVRLARLDLAAGTRVERTPWKLLRSVA